MEVILTGAGTSAFIGDVLEGPFQQKTGIRTRAVATTDLVTHAVNGTSIDGNSQINESDIFYFLKKILIRDSESNSSCSLLGED